jgi:acyl carrier protein
VGSIAATEGKMEAVARRVTSIIGEHLGVDEASLVPEANLLDDLGADSLDVVELVMALEEEFGIEVSDDDVENIRTIRDIVEYVSSRAEAAA